MLHFIDEYYNRCTVVYYNSSITNYNTLAIVCNFFFQPMKS